MRARIAEPHPSREVAIIYQLDPASSRPRPGVAACSIMPSRSGRPSPATPATTARRTSTNGEVDPVLQVKAFRLCSVHDKVAADHYGSQCDSFLTTIPTSSRGAAQPIRTSAERNADRHWHARGGFASDRQRRGLALTTSEQAPQRNRTGQQVLTAGRTHRFGPGLGRPARRVAAPHALRHRDRCLVPAHHTIRQREVVRVPAHCQGAWPFSWRAHCGSMTITLECPDPWFPAAICGFRVQYRRRTEVGS